MKYQLLLLSLFATSVQAGYLCEAKCLVYDFNYEMISSLDQISSRGEKLENAWKKLKLKCSEMTGLGYSSMLIQVEEYDFHHWRNSRSLDFKFHDAKPEDCTEIEYEEQYEGTEIIFG